MKMLALMAAVQPRNEPGTGSKQGPMGQGSSSASATQTPSPTQSIMPPNVRAGQVVGLVEVTGGLGSVIDVSRLADEFGADIATLLPILDTAEMLGLVKTDKGDVSLTELGLKFQKTAKRKVRMLREVLANIEPFRTALDLASKNRKGVSAREISEALLQKDLRWHHNPEINESLVQALLIHWAIYADLLSYDGKTGRFKKC